MEIRMRRYILLFLCNLINSTTLLGVFQDSFNSFCNFIYKLQQNSSPYNFYSMYQQHQYYHSFWRSWLLHDLKLIPTSFLTNRKLTPLRPNKVNKLEVTSPSSLAFTTLCAFNVRWILALLSIIVISSFLWDKQ